MLTVACLAEAVGVAKHRFARAFKAATRTSPHQYVLGRRIERACELLEGGYKYSSAIAYTVGLSSQTHMTDVFRKPMGTTPGRYRGEKSVDRPASWSN